MKHTLQCFTVTSPTAKAKVAQVIELLGGTCARLPRPSSGIRWRLTRSSAEELGIGGCSPEDGPIQRSFSATGRLKTKRALATFIPSLSLKRNRALPHASQFVFADRGELLPTE